MVARAPYKWQSGGPLTKIQQHSVAKHEVLRAYLIAYMQTLVVSPHQEELRVTMIDGFAGGGIYQHAVTKQILPGSPIIFLEAAKEAEALINQNRQNPIRMNVDYFFVEVDREPFAILKKVLNERGFGGRIGNDIQMLNSRFDAEVARIRSFISKKSPRTGRSIFFLDQYGYKEVPKPLIRSIFDELPATEIILTFNVDSFINYASDSDTTQRLLAEIGIPDVLRGRTFDDIKRSERDFRLYIQSCLYRELVEGCGAQYYTLFFIRTEGHGDYWLVHLSQHPRARDVMTQVHWAKNNNFIHYGGAGIDMFQVLGYSVDRDAAYTGQSDFDFCFDDPAANRSISMLMEQLPHRIYAREEGLTFGELFATTCNTSPADSNKYKEALAKLVQQREIEILSPTGAQRLRARTITDKDQLLPLKQKTFVF